MRRCWRASMAPPPRRGSGHPRRPDRNPSRGGSTRGVERGTVRSPAALPADESVTKARAEQLLIALSNLAHPVAFEIIGRPSTITVGVACRAADADELRHVLSAYFPEATVTEATTRLADLWRGGNDV